MKRFEAILMDRLPYDFWKNLSSEDIHNLTRAAEEYAESVCRHNLKEVTFHLEAPLEERQKVANFEITQPE